MSSNFFVHITDLHLASIFNAGWESLERLIQQVKVMNPQPAFVVCTGDIVFADMQIKSKPSEIEPEFQHYQQLMAGLSVPLYNALGNHDMTLCDLTPGSGQYGKALFEQYCGPRYQSFDWGNIHAVVLDQWIFNSVTCMSYAVLPA